MKSQKTVFLMKIYGAVLVSMSVVVTFTTRANADVSNTSNQAERACEIALDWQALSDSLQARLDPLEAKGVESLTGDEFEFYAQLSDGLLAVKKLHKLQTTLLIVAAKKKQREQEKIIADKRAETAEVKKTNQKIMELEKLLSGE